MGCGPRPIGTPRHGGARPGAELDPAPSVSIVYEIGIDGISLPLVLLTGLLAAGGGARILAGVTEHWPGFTAALSC